MQEIREVVDPIDQTTDLANAVSWVYGEPQCDRDRIGLWGSSYSGGHVVYVAARDPRVKATISQVPAFDSRWVIGTPEEREKTFSEAAARTHGELGYPPPGAKVIGNLRGAPIREKLMQYAPVEDAGRRPATAPCCSSWPRTKSSSTTRTTVSRPSTAPPAPKKLVIVPEHQALRHLPRSPQASPKAGRRLVRRASEGQEVMPLVKR